MEEIKENNEAHRIKTLGGLITAKIAAEKGIPAEDVAEFYMEKYVESLTEKVDKDSEYTLADILYYTIKVKPSGSTQGHIKDKFNVSKYKMQYVLGYLEALKMIKIEYITKIHQVITPTRAAQFALNEIASRGIEIKSIQEFNK